VGGGAEIEILFQKGKWDIALRSKKEAIHFGNRNFVLRGCDADDKEEP